MGKYLLSEGEKFKHGLYPQLGKQAASQIRQSTLIALEGMGHNAHVQDLAKFAEALFSFI